jgi:hypothetical protein
MIVTTHQPIFLPWPGFFYKALFADVMVLLDGVQFPLGRSWMTRNRLKSDKGELWVGVPVWRKGRGLQIIREVEICDETDWRSKHLMSIRQSYSAAPYRREHLPAFESAYMRGQRHLLDFNLDLIRCCWDVLELKGKLILQSELGLEGRGTALIIAICRALNADRYVTLPPAEKFLDLEQFRTEGIALQCTHFRPPVYPQLWGDFRYNLSTLDLVLDCGPKSREILAGSR